MASTYTPIATQTLGSNAAQVTFSSIPSTYTDLVLIISAKQNTLATTTNGYIEFNSSTTGYSSQHLYGDGTTPAAGRFLSADADYIVGDPNATDFSIYTVNIMNYSNTATNKAVLFRSNGIGTLVGVSAQIWKSTAAINTIKITASDNKGGGTADSYVTGSTFTLYGIAAA